MRWKGYGQYCPVARAAEILTERWTPLILRDLLTGSRRFNELRRGVPLMSPTLLSERLQRLERCGLVRRSRPEGARHWEYHLTEPGQQCRSMIDCMGVWGQRWAMGGISREEFDPALVMWFALKRVRTSGQRLPERRVVILFDLDAAPKGKRYWWLVLAGPEIDLCLSDPGFTVDLTWRSDARAIATMMLGQFTIQQALRSRAITLEGPVRLRRLVPSWFGFEPTQPARSGPASRPGALPSAPASVPPRHRTGSAILR
jgi:DNA-binding HxlR family transcriptional regulator